MIGISEERDKEFFAKLTIERVMFLWFLQKKGFLDLNEHYFVDRFKLIKAENKNYYNDFLKKLFFNGLCKKPNERDSAVKNLVGDVPYLNGGLFIESEIELKYGNSIEIENKIFFRVMDYAKINSEKNIPVINLMECKEWTIDERSGEVDKLNPEVLGYIFEKSINQKDLGAVYTPEEITTYICKNTIYPYVFDKINDKFSLKLEYKGDIKKDLLEHLNKEQLKELFSVVKGLRILDPAVGSGHFLVDAILTLEKIYHYLYEKDIIGWSKFEIREFVIKENLFGVDILPGAIEICKLRMFLSLAETFETKQDIHPLPNIEFNFRAGNSLIGFASKSELKQNFMSGGSSVNAITKNMDFLKKHYPEIAKKAEKIVVNLFNMNPMDLFSLRNELVHDYRTPKDNKEFQIELREVINELTKAFNKELDNQSYANLKHLLTLKTKSGKLSNNLDAKSFKEYQDLKPFHWLMEFSEVINKGGFDVVIGNPPYISNNNLDNITIKVLNSYYATLNLKWDIYVTFIERGLNLLKINSRFSYIVPNVFLTAKYAENSIKHLYDNGNLYQIDYFDEVQVFEGIGVKNVIFFFVKNKETKKITKRLDRKVKISNIIKLESVDYAKEGINSLKRNYSPILSEVVQKIKFEYIGNIGYFSYGMRLCGEDSKGNSFEKEELISEKKDRIHCVELIEGTAIENYQIKSNYYLEYNTRRVPGQLARPTFKELYLPEKIVVTKIGRRPRFAIDSLSRVCDQSVLVFVPYATLSKVNNRSIDRTIKWCNKPRKELEKISMNFNNPYLLSVMSSKLCFFILNSKRQNPLWLAPDEWKEIPIKIATSIEDILLSTLMKMLLVKIVDEVENLKNELIYELYFSDKFKEDKMPTHLAELVEPYLFDIDKLKSDEEKLKKIKEFVDKIQKDKKIQSEIEKIKSHPWIKIIEEETK